MFQLRIFLIFNTLLLLLTMTGCSKPRINPCDLLSVSEMQELDGTVTKSDWFQSDDKEPNELCSYIDSEDGLRVMLFVWKEKSETPMDVITSGVRDNGTQIIEINGVGDEAVAAFGKSETQRELKLFAAKSENGLIGFRVRKSIAENSAEFNIIKKLANKALSHLRIDKH